ncbi:hypothetical protein NDU88_003086 [Pleurodeles waltl]|uniref:N-acetylgalactosaminyl-proteoglycan 3-beta-glucuronosyltransferase n=1 Tax=Pleurodeles waltl TaxID=8319 RepID=A0AAV7W3Z8_PLEWA|nr:hypothetical protein NDU88_003086 [Pleurodeles waltl]
MQESVCGTEARGGTPRAVGRRDASGAGAAVGRPEEPEHRAGEGGERQAEGSDRSALGAFPRVMAVRSRRPWMSVVVGLILGFTAASWLIAPKVAEMSERKRRSSPCSYYGRAGEPGLGRALEPVGAGGPSSRVPPRKGKGTVPSISPVYGQEPEEEEEDESKKSNSSSARAQSSHPGSGDFGATRDKHLNFLYVGVMTAQKYLDTRAVAAYRTWAPFIPGRVEFFSSQGSGDLTLSEPLPVISLPGVDDSYPPQKKSFMMIKYMHDHYLDKYEWFMRADDDVYIKGEKLEDFLRSLNSSKPLYLGQTGLGNIEELGKLGLEPGENFCMGGPGMIFSREVLRRMVPHIGECLREMYTTHEDVEVGRCVRRFGGTQCVWSYEVRTKESVVGVCVKRITQENTDLQS